MDSMSGKSPGKFEFDLLQFLSGHEGLSVREAYEQFGKPRGFIRGTIVKSMDRMLKKGLVERDLVDGTYIYKAKQAQQDLQRGLVESFIRDRLGGSLKPIASFLADAEGIDPEEVKQLKDLLDKLEP